MTIKFNKNLLFRHLIGWIIIISIFQIIMQLEYSLTVIIIRALIEMLIFMIPYYAIPIFILPYYFSSKKLKAILLLLLLLILFLTSYYLLEFGTFAIMNNEKLLAPKFYWIMHSTVYFILIFLLSNSFYNNRITIQKLNVVNEEEMISLKQEVLFFKNQFNSNVSFDFLNYCHKNLVGQNEKISSAINIYKEILQSTFEIESVEAIPLEKELQYIEQFILLQDKIGNKAHVKFQKSGDFRSHLILPRILITYIENAFKYSIVGDFSKPIEIKLDAVKDELHFIVFNHKKLTKNFEKSTGTGLSNAKQQLDLYYENNYTILVDETELTYQVYLKINLKQK